RVLEDRPGRLPSGGRRAHLGKAVLENLSRNWIQGLSRRRRPGVFMGYLDYYQYQAEARGVRNFDDVVRCGREAAYIYNRMVLPWLPAQRTSRIAELACGHGSFLWWLKEQGFSDVSGIDSSTEQITLARQTGAKTFQMDVNGWLVKQQPESYDVLIGIDLIE